MTLKDRYKKNCENLKNQTNKYTCIDKKNLNYKSVDDRQLEEEIKVDK